MTEQAPEPSRRAGTVYGRGGVDISQDAPSGPPRAVPVLVGIGAVAVLILGYTAWTSTGGADKATTPAMAATVGQITAPSSEATSPSPGPSPIQLAAGTWLLTPLGDPDTYLTVNGEFAEMSPADPATLTVVPGLADDTCYTFQLEDGRYLRHFDYRLRFDASDDSDLFRGDATFCQEAGVDLGTVRLRSQNYPDHVVHRRDDNALYIDKPQDSDTFSAASSFAVRRP